MVAGCLHAFLCIWKYDLLAEDFFFAPELQRKVPKEYLGLNDTSSVEFPVWLKVVDILGTFLGVLFIIILLSVVCSYVLDRKKEKLDDMEAIHLKSWVIIKDTGVKGRVDGIHGNNFQVSFEDEGGRSKADWFEKDMLDKHVRRSNPFALNRSAELSLLVILTLGMVIVLALFAKIRVLEIFLGTTFNAQWESWAEYTTWRRCTAVMDLECASAFQFFTVLAFAALCASFFGLDDLEYTVERREKQLIDKLRSLPGGAQGEESTLTDALSAANDEHKFALRWAGLQGIGFYILVGIMRSLFNVVGAGFIELGMKGVEGKWLNFLDHFQPVFVFTTIVCIYNWSILQKLKDIKRPEALGNDATFKFIAVRALLLASDGQKSVLQMGIKAGILTMNQSELLNVNLLIFECCLVILVNRYFWQSRIYSKSEVYNKSVDGWEYKPIP